MNEMEKKRIPTKEDILSEMERAWDKGSIELKLDTDVGTYGAYVAAYLDENGASVDIEYVGEDWHGNGGEGLYHDDSCTDEGWEDVLAAAERFSHEHDLDFQTNAPHLEPDEPEL